MKEPLISVIVPVYKVEDYLSECVKSILAQTHKDLEVILVDDGSPDSSPEICDEWARKDSRVKVIHKENAGASAARNSGLDIAQGEYIGFIDSDDYIAHDMYEVMLSQLLASGKKTAVCSACRVYPDGSVAKYMPRFKGKTLDTEQAINAMLCGAIEVSVWSKLYKREVFDNIRFPEGEINEEIPLLIPTTIASEGVVFVDRVFYFYRIREGSVTGGQIYKDEFISLIQKNIEIMHKQVRDNGFNCKRGLRIFETASAYGLLLPMEKMYPNISDNLKEPYKYYRKILKKNIFLYLFTRYKSLKDKVLYVLIALKLLRPLYKLLGKK